MGTSDEEAEWILEQSWTPKKAAIVNEQPRHRVTLSPFLIAKYEVNQKEWMRITGSNPSIHKGEGLPVEVSWLDCEEFCRKTGLSLPTEAQWEYACRAGTSTHFAFGDTLRKEHASFDDGEGPVPIPRGVAQLALAQFDIGQGTIDMSRPVTISRILHKRQRLVIVLARLPPTSVRASSRESIGRRRPGARRRACPYAVPPVLGSN